MATYQIKRYIRPIEKVREDLVGRARIPLHPWLPSVQADEVEHIFDNIHSLDRDEWAAAFTQVAETYEESARAAESAGLDAEAQARYQKAYGYYRMARYPAPNSRGKLAAYLKSVELFLKTAQYMDPPLERIVMPFKGRPGENDSVLGYFRRPAGDERVPIVIRWGGIDTFKEEWSAMPYLARNMAMIAVDQPGTGQAPIAGSEDAERMFDPIFTWIASRPDLDPNRVGLIGGSTGGYWAAKLAHTHMNRVKAVVDWGGCAHYAFTPEWIEKAQDGEYALELAETLACAFGRSTFEEWVDYAPRLSLLDQGILDQPHAPLLLINGVNDTIFPISDMYLLLEHSGPKSARFWPTGHMARTPQTEPVVLSWIERELRRP